MQPIESVQLDRELVRRFGFAQFVKVAWHQVDPHTLVWERHMEEVCKHLEAVVHGDIRKLIINIPPGMSKSILCNVLLPCWAFTVYPSLRLGFLGASEKLNNRDARKCRMLLESKWYQERWSLSMLGDANRIEYFENEKGGFRGCWTMKQQVTGFHFDIATIDDPHKAQAFAPGKSMKDAEDAADFLDSTLPTRFDDVKGGRIIIIMQRLHEADLAGHALESGQWEHLCLPMEYDPERACRTELGGDWRTVDGELLAPQRFPAKRVADLKAGFPSARVASAQLQQNPIPADGTIFRSEYLDNLWHTEEQAAGLLYLSLDATFKETDTADFVVSSVWSRNSDGYYLRDLIRFRGDFVKTIERLGSQVTKWGGANMFTGLIIEDKANGSAIISALRKAGIGKVIEWNPGRVSKEERAFAVTPLMENNQVFFPANKPGWWANYIHELLSFPAGKHDDCVDSTTQALLYMSMIATNFRKGLANSRLLLGA